MNYVKSGLLLLTLLSCVSHAILEVNIVKTQEDSFPIVIAPFKVGGGADNGAIIANIIRDNLNRSGQFNAISTSKPITNQIDFNYWKKQKKDAIVFGRVEKVSEKVFNLFLYVYDVYSQKQLYAKKIAIHNTGARRIAHYLSDRIYYILLGQKGSFDTDRKSVV